MRILVPLTGEGTDVWYPVDAVPIGGDTYLITGLNPDPADLHWQFATGAKVRCEPRTMADGERELVAIEEAAD